MAKGREVKKALRKAGWVQVGQAGSHIRYEKAGRRQTFAYRDAAELGNTQLKIVAGQFGMTLDELRKLL